MGKKGSKAIIKNLNNNIKHLDLSKNNIGQGSILALCQWLKKVSIGGHKCPLRVLNLSGNRLSDKTIVTLADSLIHSNPSQLIELDLSKNQMQCKAACELADFVSMASSLVNLKLSWNKIKAHGGAALCEGLKTSKKIRNLDLSWNILNSCNEQDLIGLQFPNKFAQFIDEKKVLHIDISFNSLTKDQCERIGDLIKENHSLFGLHVHGNNCSLDSLGFVVTKSKTQMREDWKYNRNNVIGYTNRDGKTIRFKQKSEVLSNLKTGMNCWICEGWREQTFTVYQGRSINNLSQPVFIHFEFNNYQPELMVMETET